MSREQAEILRQTLLRLGAEVYIQKGEIRIIGRLAVGVGTKKVGAKADALERGFAPLSLTLPLMQGLHLPLSGKGDRGIGC